MAGLDRTSGHSAVHQPKPLTKSHMHYTHFCRHSESPRAPIPAKKLKCIPSDDSYIAINPKNSTLVLFFQMFFYFFTIYESFLKIGTIFIKNYGTHWLHTAQSTNTISNKPRSAAGFISKQREGVASTSIDRHTPNRMKRPQPNSKRPNSSTLCATALGLLASKWR